MEREHWWWGLKHAAVTAAAQGNESQGVDML